MDSCIARIVEMGYDPKVATIALIASGANENDVGTAIEFIFEHPEIVENPEKYIERSGDKPRVTKAMKKLQKKEEKFQKKREKQDKKDLVKMKKDGVTVVTAEEAKDQQLAEWKNNVVTERDEPIPEPSQVVYIDDQEGDAGEETPTTNSDKPNDMHIDGVTKSKSELDLCVETTSQPQTKSSNRGPLSRGKSSSKQQFSSLTQPMSPRMHRRQHSLTKKAHLSDENESIEEDVDEYEDSFIDEDEEFYEEDFSGDDIGFGDDDDFMDADEMMEEEKSAVITESDVKNSQLSDADMIAKICSVTLENAQVLLRHYHFDKEKLLQDYANDADQVLSKAVVSGGQSKKPITEWTCQICFDDFEEGSSELVAMDCGHGCCSDCWGGYLGLKIKEGEVQTITCCAFKCNMCATDEFVKSLVSDAEYSRYREFLSKKFVDENPNMRWCPAPSCTQAVDISGLITTDVAQCVCGHRFCYRCSNEPHEPATCSQLVKWKRKCEDDSETYNWISVNTQECPKCHTSIEKNGGCNHVTCKKCRHEFCWVCLSNWQGHSYSCNRYDKRKEQDKSDQKRALERYLHFYHRFVLHGDAIQKEEVLKEKVVEKMAALTTAGQDWVDVQYLQESFDQLNSCREVLRYSYVYSFFQPEGPQKNLFEYLQNELEATTDQLAELLEKKLSPEMRIEIIDRSRNAGRKLHNLLQNE